jgi:FixJ family two-component response regulator
MTDQCEDHFSYFFSQLILMFQAFCSAEECLESASFSGDNCIILDMRMPGMTGLDLQKKLTSRKIRIPVIVVSAYDDARTRDLARELGAVASFRKPVDDQTRIHAIEWAMGEKVKDKQPAISGKWE